VASPAQVAPVLTPNGRLRLDAAADAPALSPQVAERLHEAFARGSGPGLLQIGAAEVDAALPPVLGYWRAFAARYVTMLCTHAADACRLPDVRLSEEELAALASAAPPMLGAEYLTPAVLLSLWEALDTAFRSALANSGQSVQDFLKSQHAAWNLVGRVYFNLAENRLDAEAPFAFLATYTSRLSAHARAEHLPLGRALSEYAGAKNRSRLLSLLLPVQRAANQCPWLKTMVDTREVFHPLRWTPAEAFQFLTDLPRLESAGVVVRVPGTWRSNRPSRPQVSATVGGKPPSGIGRDALLDFRMDVTLDGEALTTAEVAALLAASDGLHLVRGRWIEVNRDRLGRLLDQFRAVEKAAARDGLTFAEAARLVAGARISDAEPADIETPEWSRVVAGPWLGETLNQLRNPGGLAAAGLDAESWHGLNATLRPYQQTGVRWLHLLSSLGLGACLADDMGLGKTLQVLALIVTAKSTAAPPQGREAGTNSRRTSLVVAPASLLENWASEAARFAPTLRILIAHPSSTGLTREELHGLDADRLADVDLVITSYGTLTRVPALTAIAWRLAVLDEAQAIKNPGARQTRTAKHLDAHARIALTGTPVENRLGDLWSLFDFVNPGLLGTGKEFARFTKRLVATPGNAYGPLRELVRPYILRRLKTDKAVIADLPDKTEVKAFCSLTRAQAALYQRGVADLSAKLAEPDVDGITRKGVVLAFLMRFKQICNHPSQWLGDDAWVGTDSGKFARLREIAEVIAAKQEKVLVFTQFREMTGPIAAFLASVFGRAGLVLHGGTDVKRRPVLVERFQTDDAVPFFVLSLKAGGAGLNLTAASHVIHFDRWWNPAVENQATDRAFRIGQTKNVLVHKFCARDRRGED
jgi:non-specific serine/threonine protein kinase